MLQASWCFSETLIHIFVLAVLSKRKTDFEIRSKPNLFSKQTRENYRGMFLIIQSKWNHAIGQIIEVWLGQAVHTVAPYFDAHSITCDKIGRHRGCNWRLTGAMVWIGRTFHWSFFNSRLVFQYGWKVSPLKNNPKKIVTVSGSRNVWLKSVEGYFHMTTTTIWSVDGFVVTPLLILPGKWLNR